jgi:gallate decarboxylase subunit D
MKRYTFEVSEGRFKIQALVQKVGQDILVSVWGGTLPHIGAVGMATPRPSLRDPKKMSATSSTFTYVGHKEDGVVKRISELLASRLKTKVVVSAGIHWDDLTSREIDIIAKLTQKLSARILEKLEKPE